MTTRWRLATAAALAVAALACGTTTSGGGGGGVVKADTTQQDAAQGDVAAADVPEADVPVADDVAVEDSAPVVDTAATEDAAPDVAQDTKPLKLNGALVNPPLDPPTFTKVVDSTGAKVSPDALQGHWTVLWFYPAASTAG